MRELAKPFAHTPVEYGPANAWMVYFITYLPVLSMIRFTVLSTTCAVFSCHSEHTCCSYSFASLYTIVLRIWWTALGRTHSSAWS